MSGNYPLTGSVSAQSNDSFRRHVCASHWHVLQSAYTKLVAHHRTFEIPREDGKASARTDPHCAAVRFCLLRQIDMHLRRADTAEFDDLAPRDEFVLRFVEITLRTFGFRRRSRRRHGPEVENLGLCRVVQTRVSASRGK